MHSLFGIHEHEKVLISRIGLSAKAAEGRGGKRRTYTVQYIKHANAQPVFIGCGFASLMYFTVNYIYEYVKITSNLHVTSKIRVCIFNLSEEIIVQRREHDLTELGSNGVAERREVHALVVDAELLVHHRFVGPLDA